MNDFGNSSPNYTHQQETGLGEFGFGCLLFGMVLEKKKHQVLVTPGGFRRYHPSDHPIVCQKKCACRKSTPTMSLEDT